MSNEDIDTNDEVRDGNHTQEALKSLHDEVDSNNQDQLTRKSEQNFVELESNEDLVDIELNDKSSNSDKIEGETRSPIGTEPDTSQGVVHQHSQLRQKLASQRAKIGNAMNNLSRTSKSKVSNAGDLPEHERDINGKGHITLDDNDFDSRNTEPVQNNKSAGLNADDKEKNDDYRDQEEEEIDMPDNDDAKPFSELRNKGQTTHSTQESPSVTTESFELSENPTTPKLPPRSAQEKNSHPKIMVKTSSSSTTPNLPDRKYHTDVQVFSETDPIKNWNQKLRAIFENTFDEIRKQHIDAGRQELINQYSDEIANSHDTCRQAFWRQLLESFPELSDAQLKDVHELLQTQSITNDMRGLLWELFSFSRTDDEVDVFEKHLQTGKNMSYDYIKKLEDNNEVPLDLKPKILELFQAYLASTKDTEGCEYLTILAIPLIQYCRNLPSAYSLFTRLSKVYRMKDLMTPGSISMDQLLYKYDRWLETKHTKLYRHLSKAGLKSSIYAAKWMSTLFSEELSHDIVPSIIDVIILEGPDSLLKFSLYIMIQNKDKLMDLKFEELLDYIKNKSFKNYLRSHTAKQFVQDALVGININPGELAEFSSEYDDIHQSEIKREDQYKEMFQQNLELQNNVRKLEKEYTSLSREHVTIANELLKNRLKIDEVANSNLTLKREILNTRKELSVINPDKYDLSKQIVPGDLKKQLTETMQLNSRVMNKNLKLQDEIVELESQIDKIKAASEQGILYVDNDKNRTLGTGWKHFKKVFEKR